MTLLKKVAGKIHLWLGLISGLIVCHAGLTGCIYAFQEEIRLLSEPYRIIHVENKEFLSPMQLAFIASARFPGKEISSMVYKKNEASIVNFTESDYNFSVYQNPYSGKIVYVKDQSGFNFFSFILYGHRYLYLPKKIGEPIVNYSTLIFVVVLITGLILWWPKNRKAAKKRVAFKWSALTKWKRKNYDLHSILGFYTFPILLIVALSGMTFGLKWFYSSLYWATTKGKTFQEYKLPVSDTSAILHSPALIKQADKLWKRYYGHKPSKNGVDIYFPASSTGAIDVIIYPEKGTFYRNDMYAFDRYSLKEIKQSQPFNGRYSDALPGEKFMKMNYDIHVGSVLGLPGKVLAFICSLIAASLPVTGFYIWLGRRDKKRKSGADHEL